MNKQELLRKIEQGYGGTAIDEAAFSILKDALPGFEHGKFVREGRTFLYARWQNGPDLYVIETLIWERWPSSQTSDLLRRALGTWCNIKRKTRHDLPREAFDAKSFKDELTAGARAESDVGKIGDGWGYYDAFLHAISGIWEVSDYFARFQSMRLNEPEHWHDLESWGASRCGGK